MKRYILTLLLCGLFFTTAAEAQTLEPAPDAEQLIEPQIARRDIIIPRIDTENVEVEMYAGMLSVEDFGVYPTIGLRTAVYVSEDLFIAGSYSIANVSDKSFRDIGLPIFRRPEQRLAHFDLTLGYNALPGQFFIGQRRALNSALYLMAGVGNTSLNNEDYFTLTAGAGWRLLFTDWFALHLDARNFLFKTDILGTRKTVQNIELSTGVSVFF